MLGLSACSLNPQPTPPGPELEGQAPNYAPPSSGVDSTEGGSATEANTAGAPEPGTSTTGAGDDGSFNSEGESPPPPTGVPATGAGGAAGSDADSGGAAGAAGAAAAELI